MEFLKQYEILNKKAITDLKTSIIILQSFEDGDNELDLETIMFHLQQCAEKFIKSILDFNNIKFPHTHDIDILVNLINSNNIDIPLKINDFSHLTDYAVEGRYAILHDDIEDAHTYIEQLKQLKQFIQNNQKDKQ